jgi:twitching motility protein PilT
MFDVDAALMAVIETEASDLHLKVPAPPIVRQHGKLVPLPGLEQLRPEDTEATLFHMLTDEAKLEAFRNEREVDFSYSVPGVARFRVNAFVQRGAVSLVCRAIPFEIKTAEELMLPPVIDEIADEERGLILLTGTTGSGKSTTLAAMIDHINTNYAKHIVTIEDPVEFVHENQRSVFSHREVGAHTGSFGAALRATIRQDADVVLVGEMRDRETIALAITAAEMGLLVFGTLHTNGAAKTIDRVVDAFPAKEQDQVRLSLSESLAAVVSQLLLPTADGRGRCAVHEVLLRTPGLANVIREGNTPMLTSIIQAGRSAGMQAMDDALFALAKEGRVRPEDAAAKAGDKARFQVLLGGGAVAG